MVNFNKSIKEVLRLFDNSIRREKKMKYKKQKFLISERRLTLNNVKLVGHEN